MKKLFFLFMMMLLPVAASAYDDQIDGIYYNFNTTDKTAEVTYLYEYSTSNQSAYSGAVVIPEKVVSNGTTYSVTSIGRYAFYNCNGLSSIAIPNSVTSIGKYAFAQCRGLTSVDIPNSVTSIGSNTFENCNGLTSITIPNSVTSIGRNTFNGTPWYDNWYNSQPDGLLYRNNILWGYKGDKPIGGVEIDGTTRFIASGALENCDGLTSVTIPNSVTSIGEDAFHGCVGLTSIIIPNSVIYIGESAFMYCSGLASLTIPNSVKTIDHEAFEDCSALTSVIIGNGVATIGGEAFKDCSSLKSVVIGRGITTIMGLSFGNCKLLTDVYCYAEAVPTTDSDTFKKTNIENATLHVPETSLGAYTEAVPWKDFKSIVPIEGTFPDNPDTPETKKCAKPTISFVDGELEFSCETEGVEYVSEVTVSDAKKYYSSKVSITGIYKVSVYATKAGYENSDIAITEIQLPINGTGKQGDLNGDGTIDVGDIMAIINKMAGQ